MFIFIRLFRICKVDIPTSMDPILKKYTLN